jgi:hypothetical protein
MAQREFQTIRFFDPQRFQITCSQSLGKLNCGIVVHQRVAYRVDPLHTTDHGRQPGGQGREGRLQEPYKVSWKNPLSRKQS